MSLNVIDVSGYQRGIDLSKITNLDGVFCKATEGTGFVNPSCDATYQLARKLGKHRGFYHFAGSSIAKKLFDPRDEADFFYKNTKGYVKDGIPMLDFEPYGYEPADPVGWVSGFTGAYHMGTGVWPVLYMSIDRVNEWHRINPAGAEQLAKTVALFIAGGDVYNTVFDQFSPPLHRPAVPNYWTVFGWQYSSNGSFANCHPVDVDVAYVDAFGWEKYVAGDSAKPATFPPKPVPAKAPTPVPAVRYVVKSGDNLSSIANQFHTTVQIIVNSNRIADPNKIYAGEVLTIPSGMPHTYTVRTGDTLEAIARAHGTSWQFLQKINKIPNPNEIYPGQVLRLA